MFIKSAPVLYSYFHTHPASTEEMLLYVGPNATMQPWIQQVILDGLLPGARELKCGYAHDTRAQLLERAELAGAKFACHFYRSSRLRQVVPDTAETDDAFYRKSAGCMPFEMIAGQSFAIIVFTSPSSAAASKVHASHDQPQTFLALVSWRVSTRLCACM